MEIDMIDKRLPMFKISSDVWESLSIDDIDQTASDMFELGIYHPPFNSFYIHAKVRFMEKLAEAAWRKKLDYYLPIRMEMVFLCVVDGSHGKAVPLLSRNGIDFFPLNEAKMAVAGPEVRRQFSWMSTYVVKILVVLLATKNIEKEVEICNKPNSRNRRERTISKYSSVTTIRVGKVTETVRSSNNSGGPVRAHLRRGHIRHQHYGKNNSEVKKIFIQPVFVNADQGWIDGQKEYRVVA